MIALIGEMDKLVAAIRGSTGIRSGHRNTHDLSMLSLAEKSCWVAWREDEEVAGDLRNANGKPRKRKVPYNPISLFKARSNDPRTWGTRAQSVKATRRLLANGERGGVGIQLGLHEEYSGMALCGLDLDSCLDPQTNTIEPWAADVLDRFRSRTEVSPGLQGLKVFFLLSAQDWRSFRQRSGNKARVLWSRGSHCELALDLDKRYYTVTDRLVCSQPKELNIIGLSELMWLVESAGPSFVGHGRNTRAQDEHGKVGRDESGSGHGFRYLLCKARDRCAAGQAIADLLEDMGPAGEWARRTDDRQHRRAWERAAARAEIDAQQGASIFEDDDEPETGSAPVDPTVAKLNELHALVVIKGRSLVSTLKDDGSFDFGTIKDLDALYANQPVPYGDRKTEPVSRRWFKSTQRQTYSNGVGIYFDDPPPNTLNLWRGWAVEPSPAGSCEKFLWHLRHVICAGDEEQYNYVIGWLAHLVQHPSEKPGVAVVVRGAKGSGKDTAGNYVARFIGRRHAPTVAQMSHITGKFNAHLEAALLLHIQEGVWAGNREGESVLKYLITSEQVAIERKGMDSYSLPSFLRLFISANADWIVPASADERRFAVFEASDLKKGDGSYFRALHEEMNGQGPAALLHMLQTYDLSDFDVRRPPASVGLRKQKLESLRGFDKWWFEKLFNCSLGADDSSWRSAPLTIAGATLRSDYESWTQKHRFEGDPIIPSQFGERLHKFIPHLTRHRPIVNGERTWCYQIPILSACRTQFETNIGVCDIDWDV